MWRFWRVIFEWCDGQVWHNSSMIHYYSYISFWLYWMIRRLQFWFFVFIIHFLVVMNNAICKESIFWKSFAYLDRSRIFWRPWANFSFPKNVSYLSRLTVFSFEFSLAPKLTLLNVIHHYCRIKSIVCDWMKLESYTFSESLLEGWEVQQLGWKLYARFGYILHISNTDLCAEFYFMVIDFRWWSVNDIYRRAGREWMRKKWNISPSQQ